MHPLAYGLPAAAALALALRSLTALHRHGVYYAERLGDARQARYLPRVALIVPVKGPEEDLAGNLRSLATQDYPDYELLVVARAMEDVPAGVVPDGARLILAGEGDALTGEKINNLLAAIREADSGAEVFAFADSDGRVEPGWLRALVAPLAEPGVGASTGYRVYLPDPPDVPSLLRALWNGSILATFGRRASLLAWGGATAFRRDVFYEAKVPEFWRGCVSDDYRLAEAVRRAGRQIRFAPAALVLSSDHIAAAALARWIRRQLVITRVYNPLLWRLSALATVVYCGATSLCLTAAVAGDVAALVLLLPLAAQEVIKTAGWLRLAVRVFPAARTWASRHGGRLLGWAALTPWIWLAGLAASAFSNKIEWRGRQYRLARPPARALV